MVTVAESDPGLFSAFLVVESGVMLFNKREQRKMPHPRVWHQKSTIQKFEIPEGFDPTLYAVSCADAIIRQEGANLPQWDSAARHRLLENQKLERSQVLEEFLL